MNDSPLALFKRLPGSERDRLLASLSPREIAVLAYQWENWTARPDQIEPPGDWTYWLILAGRGYGKTRTGAEWTRKSAGSGEFQHINLIAATSSDARDIMIEGESGILAVCPEWERPTYRVSKSRLDWPNGCRSLIFTADEPERLRGKQHERLWADEVAAWRYPEAWDQAMYGLRIGPSPRAVVTTTPRPTQLVKDLRAHPSTVLTVGTTYDNRDNLAAAFYDTIIGKYEGTRQGRQELLAEILEDVPGALWTRDNLDQHRVAQVPYDLGRIVVAVDPAASHDPETGSAETGIVVAGHCPMDDRYYVLADVTVMDTPERWARRAVNAYQEWGADMIVAERNQGGAMVESTLRTVDRNAPVRLVWASKGKHTRAEPISALYEQGRVSHVGVLPQLEDQMCSWVQGDDSPDRMDALVWALTELSDGRGGRQYRSYDDEDQPRVRIGDLTLVGEHYIDRT